MAFSKKAIAKAWDIEGMANDLREAPWYVTEGPRGDQRYTRIHRRTLLGTAEVIEREAKNLLSKQEIKEAEEYLNALAEIVAKELGQHVYGSFEEGDAWLGQYEEGPFEELDKRFNIDEPASMSGASMDGRGANDLAVEFVNGAVTG